jgi:spore germination protein
MRNLFLCLICLCSKGVFSQSQVTLTLGYPDHPDYFIYSIPPASENAKFGGEYYFKIENTGSVDLVDWQLHTFWKALNSTWGVVQKTVLNSATGEIRLEGPTWDGTLSVGESIVLNGEWIPSSSVEDWVDFLPRNSTMMSQGQMIPVVYNTTGSESVAAYQVQKIKPFDISRKTFANKKIVAYFPIFDAENAWCSLQRYGKNIDELRIQLYSITPQGVLRAGQDLPNSLDPIVSIDYWFNFIDSLGVVDYCVQNGIQLVPVAYNYNGDLNDFDQNAVHTMMVNPTLRTQHISDLHQRLVAHPEFAGIDVDYESLLGTDRENYASFMEDLALDVHGLGKILTTAVHTKVGAGTWDGPQAQDYERIGNAVDELLLMTYDLHWATSPTFSSPPPTAGCQSTPDWMNDVASFAISEINDPSKIQLGLPFYGYRWKQGFEAHTLNDPGVGLTYYDAQELIEQNGITPTMITRESHGYEPTFTVSIGSVNWVCYFQDSASLNYKLTALLENDLADYIGGVGIWRLGKENDGMWRAVVSAVKHTNAIIENSICTQSLGTNELVDAPTAIQVFPNPCSDILNVNYVGKPTILRMRNTIGQLLFEKNIEQGSSEISTTHLSVGVYYIEINNTISIIGVNR